MIDFLQNIWGPQANDKPYFCLSTKSKKTGIWKDHFFKWPIRRLKYKEFFENFPTEKYNLYFCPHPFSKPERQKKYVLATNLLWADLDHSHPESCKPVPQIAWESSPKRYAALWRLTDFLDPGEIEEVNKGLTYASNADKGCWNLTRVLRIPGSRNHKYSGSPKGKLLWNKDNEYGLEKFETSFTELDPLKVLKEVKKKLKGATYKLLTVGKATKGERSDMLWRLQRELREQGLNDDQIFSLIKSSVWNKFRGRHDEVDQLTRELNKGKVDDNPEKPALAGLSERKQKLDELPFVVCLDTVKSEKVDFLWFPYIPLGKLTILEGDPGLGKSYLTMKLATAVANRERLPGNEQRAKGKVLLMSSEDGLADTIKPRLESMDANTSNIYAVQKPVTFDEPGLIEIEEQLERIKPSLLIIDPLVAYLGGSDMNKASEMRIVMQNLGLLAEQHHCAIICVRHLTKGTKEKAIYRGTGSIDILAAARSVLFVARDPDNINGRIICQTKMNLAREGEAVLFELLYHRRNIFRWNGTRQITAEQILSSTQNTGTGFNDTQLAEEFIFSSLKDGPKEPVSLKMSGESNGISWDTLKKVAKELDVSIYKSDKGITLWKLKKSKERN